MKFVALLGAAGLAGIGAVHAAWGLGSSWPMRTREELADAVVGNDETPGPEACFVMAGVAISAAALLAGAGGQGRGPRTARWMIAAGLAARGVLGGRAATRVLGLPDPSERFVRLDTIVYRPLCLTLAAASATAAAN
ncbi:DUF3995 domain-containing protein [Candidatus Protofrankia californiensis]|uniref:DUF3995 domain-containing protein n=1 Tax=Candidatus Protofrankia californiensis TaxID=1839754 RepID=UPI001040F4F3|nr:DUF3995 domain-containing protein [Candidatus Protofrankia californiensis]